MIDFDWGWLNIGSLVLRLIAWTLPIVNLLRDPKPGNQKWVVFAFISISACAVSICLQVFYNYYLVRIEDWSALMDTMGAVVMASTVLVAVTLILNVLTLILRYRSGSLTGK